MNFKQYGKLSQPLLISILILLTIALSVAIWSSAGKKPAEEHGHEEGEHAEEHESEGQHEEGEIQLAVAQFIEQGLKTEVVSTGPVDQIITLPGKLVVNTDQQAHVSPNFSGHVEQVYVSLGQKVEKGQALAALTVPELIDQQENLKMAEATLSLTRQEYQREQQLWSQGISAKQDYLRAENAYKQAQISVQSARARLNALGASGNNNGRFMIRAPISGTISQKDIVVGENVQLADQLFVIEQLKDLWLEFNLPNQFSAQLKNGQRISFKTIGSGQVYSAVMQSLTSQADAQTGRLVARAKLESQAEELRPNVMVNVLIRQPSEKTALRIPKSALQQIEGEDSVFIVESEEKGQVHLKAQSVVVGQASTDGQWLEVISGLSEGQKLISQGSFLLKSELEKDETGHEH